MGVVTRVLLAVVSVIEDSHSFSGLSRGAALLALEALPTFITTRYIACIAQLDKILLTCHSTAGQTIPADLGVL